MSLRRRMMMGNKQGGVPSGYTRLKYIEGTGTQYLDTEISNDVVDYKFEFDAVFLTPYSAQNKTFIGDGNRDKRLKLNFLIGGSGVGYWQIYFRGLPEMIHKEHYPIGTIIHNIVIVALEKQFWEANNIVKINDNLSTIVPGTNPILIFAGNSTETGNYGKPMEARLYNMKIYIYSTDTLIADYIPCARNKDGQIGLYDLVSGKFLTNAGTGEFIGG